MIIERFEQGITVRWRDLDGNVSPTKSLASKGGEATILGEEVWGDINDVLANTLSEKVLVKLEYEALNR